MAQTANLGLPLIDENMTADVPRDMNALANAVDTAVTEAVAGVTVPDATTTQKGVVQLSNATNGTRENVAATEKAVGQAFQAGNERKAEVVAALVAIGVPASTSETWAQLIPKIAAVIRATGNATVSDVIAGKTFSNATANGLTGNIPDRGAGGTVTPGTTDQSQAAGRYTSAITIKGEPNLIAGNLPKDKTFFGIVGLLERMTTAEKQAIANAITSKGVVASVNDTNTVLANKISQIKTGIQVATGTFADPKARTISNLPFQPFIALVYCRGNVATSNSGTLYIEGYAAAYLNGGRNNILPGFKGQYRSNSGITDELNIQYTSINFYSNSVNFELPHQYTEALSYVVFGY